MNSTRLPTLQNIISRLLISNLIIFSVVVFFAILGGSIWGGQKQIEYQWQSTYLLAHQVSEYITTASQMLQTLTILSPTEKGFANFEKSNDYFDVLYQIDKEGQLIEVYPPDSQFPAGRDMSAQPYFDPELTTLLISDPIISPRSGNPVIYMTLPNTNRDGFVVGELNLARLQDSIVRANLFPIGVFYTTDQYGYLLTHPEYKLVRQHTDIRRLGILERASEGPTSQLYMADGMLVVGIIVRIPQLGWWAITQAPVVTIYGPFFIPSVLGLILAVLLFWITVQREKADIAKKVVGPLSALSHKAQALASGDFTPTFYPPLQTISFEEVDILSNSFERMKRAVQTREDAILENEARYRSLFEDSAFPIWEEDFSAIKTFFEQLRARGISNFREYFESRPEDVKYCGSLIKVIDVNQEALKVYQASKKSEVINGLLSCFTEESWELFKEELIALAEGKQRFGGEAPTRILNGELRILFLHLSVDPSCQETLSRVIVSLVDITGRIRAEEQVRASLKEKEMLLKEIHHRVKNNLNMICSLLDLQADHIKDTSSLNAFRDSQTRIRAIARLHENLYRAQHIGLIESREYIEDLVANMRVTYSGIMNEINTEVSIEPMMFDLDTAIPLGLILNELITNIFKHAFPEGWENTIHRPDHTGKDGAIVQIELRKQEQMATLAVSDNGIDFPENIDPFQTQSLGLQLVSMLTQQLEGNLEVKRDKGTKFQITWRLKDA